uniref:F-box domain-containing protein n=1 Tax=Steinernema glaseri TaxID=37863 RepID=A0A1I7YUE0_9BILA
MDNVPQLFIESVIRLVPNIAERIPAPWRKIGDEYLKKRGQLILTYALSNPRDLEAPWCLRYRLFGFEHIKTRTLSKDVVREMAKSITSFKFDISHKTVFRAGMGNWPSISPDDKDTIRLLVALDAPGKELLLSPDKVFKWYTEVGSRYFYLWRSFTSLRFISGINDMHGVPSFLQFLESVVPVGNLRSLNISSPANLEELRQNTPDLLSDSFWADLFFSEGCTELTSGPLGLSVAEEIIGRWKQMEPWKLAPNKTFYCTGDSDRQKSFSDRVKSFQSFISAMTTMPLESAAPRILEKVKRRFPKDKIVYLYYIDHPSDPRFRIYVAFNMEDKAHRFLKPNNWNEFVLLAELSPQRDSSSTATETKDNGARTGTVKPAATPCELNRRNHRTIWDRLGGEPEKLRHLQERRSDRHIHRA